MYFEEMTVGMRRELAPVLMEKDEMLAFSRRYDNVPLHTDEAYAAGTHFGQIIAAGMMSFLVVWAKYLEQDFFSEELLAGTSQRVDWHSPVFAGDTLCGTAEITALHDRSPRNGLAELTIRVKNQRGEMVLTGVTECIVKKRSG